MNRTLVGANSWNCSLWAWSHDKKQWQLEGIQDWDGNLGVEPIDGIIVCRHGLMTKDNHNSKVGIQVWHGILGVVQWSDDTYS
jgi:hypothetical protein